MTTTTKPTKKPAADKSESKIVKVIALMSRKKGASINEMVKATGWLPHSTHAALSGLRKKGLMITRTKDDGASRYTIAKESA